MDTKNAIAALAALAQESRLAIFRLLVEVGPDGQVALILMFGTISGAHFNPAVTLARAASNTFAGIRPGDAPGFMIAQLLGAAAATGVFCWLSLSGCAARRNGSWHGRPQRIRPPSIQY